MGYTHYSRRAAELPADAFAKAVSDCQKALAHTDIPLAGPMGTGKPVFNGEELAFNGPDKQGCETFRIDRCVVSRDHEPRVFNFCKTNHARYDICVQVALIVFAHHFGEAFLVSSDGNDANWDAARRLCADSLGYGSDFRLIHSR